MGKRDKSTARKRSGNSPDGAYPLELVKIWIMKVASLFFFVCSCALFFALMARILLVPFEGQPRVKALIDYIHNDVKAYRRILDWWAGHINVNAARTLLPVMGIFNFTYTQILSARGQKVYGLSLHEVIKAHFPWGSVVYALYAVWIVVGLIVNAGEDSLIVPSCFAGVFSSFLSALIISCLFVTSRANAQRMVEMYLCDDKVPKTRHPADSGTVLPSGVKDYLRVASGYVREYYKDSGNVPKKIIARIWDRFEFDIAATDMPVMALRQKKNARGHKNQGALKAGAQQPDHHIYEELTAVRYIWENTLNGLSWDKQADLAAKVIQVLSDMVPEEQNKQTRGGQRAGWRKEVYRRLGMPLCGLVSLLRNQAPPPEHWDEYLGGLRQCIAQVYKISGSAPGAGYAGEDPVRQEKYTEAVRMLFLLLEATVITESLGWSEVMLKQEKNQSIWHKLYGMGFQLGVPEWMVSRFLLWGQCIVDTSASEWFGSETGLINIYYTRQWLEIILSSFKTQNEE